MPIFKNKARLAVLLGSTLLLWGQPSAAQEDDDEPQAETKRITKQKTDPGDETTGNVAASEADQAAIQAATAVLSEYLDVLKAKKWDKARGLTHPLTMKQIANTKKRLGEERASMAPWFWAKGSFYLTNYKIDKVSPAMDGTIVAKTLEDSFQVQEKGVLSGEKAAYLLGRSGGKWYVVDKKSEADGFTKDAIHLGYKGYFDPVSK